MVSLSIFNRGASGDGDDQEVALGVPDEAEAKDLVRHVERCAMRFRFFTSKLRNQSADIRQVKFLIYGLCIFILITSHPAQELFQFLGSLK